jgi:hypothetical protein
MELCYIALILGSLLSDTTQVILSAIGGTMVDCNKRWLPLLEYNKKSDTNTLAQWPKSPKEKRARGCGSEFKSLLGHFLFLIAFMPLPPII